MFEIGRYYPEKEMEIRDFIFTENKIGNGNFICTRCNLENNNKGYFHIDHIKPMSKGGLTKKENLQVLCRTCNLRKSDSYND